MASIFDNFSTLNLTPQELKALQLSQQGGGLMGALAGEYLPRAEGIESDRPRIGADPVSTQQQSRTGGKPAGKTFYANTAGDIGTSVPKGAGTSGIYSEVAEDAAKVAGKGLGVVNKFLGPVGVLADFVNAPEVGDAELTPEQEAEMAKMAVNNMAPQVQEDAVNFAQGVSDRAVNQAMGRGNPIDLRDPQAPRSNLYDQNRSPSNYNPPMEMTPVGPAPPMDPRNDAQKVAAGIQQREAAQQNISQTATQQLSEGTLTRPQAAEAVVKADAERQGVALTPDQEKEAVAGELASMKSMDNSQLGDYLSYALIAGGLIASFTDKSGETGRMLTSSFNKQLDRNLVEGQARRKAEAAKAQLQYDMAKDERDFGLKEQDLERKKGDSAGLKEYRGAKLKLDEEGLQVRRDEAASSAAGRAAAQAAREANYARQDARAAQQQSNWEKMFGLQEGNAKRQAENDAARIKQGQERIRQGNEANLIAAGKADAAANKGPGMTTKEAEDAIKATADAQGVNLDKAVVKAAGQQLRQHASNNAKAVQANPTGIINQILQGQQYQTTPRKPGYIWDTDPEVKLK